MDRHRVNLEVALTVGVLLLAVNSPLRLSLVVSLILFSLSALCSIARRSASSSWTQTYLNSLVLLGIFAFSWVLFVSHESIAVRLLTVSGGVLASGTVLVALGRVTVDQLLDNGADSGRWPTELVVPAVAAVLLAIRGLFPLLATALALLVSVLITRQRVSLRTVAVVAGLCGVTIPFSRSWFDREPYWFFISYDQQFRASLATGLTRWGYTDLNSATGTSISYHWLAEAISGVLSRITNVDEFIVVTRAVPVIGFLAAVSAMWRVVRTLGLAGGAALVGVAVPSLVLLEMDPHSIGTLLGVAFTCYVVELAMRGQSDSIRMFAIVVVATLSLMAQTPFGLTASLALFVHIGISARAVRFGGRRWLALGLIPIILVLLRRTVLAPGISETKAGDFGVENFMQFGGLNVDFGISPDSPVWLTVLNSTGYLLEILIIALPVLTFLRCSRQYLDRTNGTTMGFLTVLLVMSIAVINLLDLGIARGKLMSAVLVSFMPVGIAMAWSFARRTSGLRLSLLSALTGIGLARLYFLLRNAQPDGVAAALSGVLLALAVVMMVLACRAIRDSVRTGGDSQSKSTVLAAAVVLALVVGVSIGRPERMPVMLSRQPIDATVISGSPELRTCLDWVRQNTDINSVIATDFFDPESLPGSGKSHLVSLISKRRVLLDGLYDKIAEQELIDQRKLRAEALTETSIPVDYFVISSEFASSSVTSGLTVMLANSTCVVLRTELR